MGESNGYDALVVVGVKLSWNADESEDSGAAEVVDEIREEGKLCDARLYALLDPCKTINSFRHSTEFPL